MTWDPLQYGNITTLPVAVAEYWTPGLIYYLLLLSICLFVFFFFF